MALTLCLQVQLLRITLHEVPAFNERCLSFLDKIIIAVTSVFFVFFLNRTTTLTEELGQIQYIFSDKVFHCSDYLGFCCDVPDCVRGAYNSP
jgi:hypothetical protein